MPFTLRKTLAATLCAGLLAACGGAEPPAPGTPGFGADPALPAPKQQSLGTTRIAPAHHWPKGAAPAAPAGFRVARFAEGLDHPRWIHVLSNGDVLVAESSTEPSPPKTFMQWATQRVQERAGALQKSPNRITLLRDADKDGVAEYKTVLVAGLKQPFGMLYLNGALYVAETDALVRFPFEPGQTRIDAAPQTVLPLPYNKEYNGHWTRNVIANADGSKLYVSVGSVSNVGDRGMKVEEGRAAIWELAPDGSGARLYATGLRNPNGMDWAPGAARLWTVVNERDLLGDDLVPDYLTSVREGGFYGWPYAYYGTNPDPRFKPGEQKPDLVSASIKPDYALGSHTASLGLTFYEAGAFPERFRGGAFIGQHGSWNRSTLSGYKVVYVPFRNGAPNGPPEDFLTGFVDGDGRAQGRPVGVEVDAAGALLVADDVGDIIWRVTPS